MNVYAKLIAAAAAVLVVAVVGYQFLPGNGGFGGEPTPSTQPSPSTLPTQVSTQAPNTSVAAPFDADGFGMCPGVVVDPPCVEDPSDDSITFTFERPSTWELSSGDNPWAAGNQPPNGAAVFFYRGNWLYSEPCHPTVEAGTADVRVGPTVDDFATALVDHPLLDVTAPVDVTLAGFSGKYLDLQVPADISACAVYQPIGSHIYAQGPGQRWHMWVLDIDGVRVLVETNDYAGTTPQRLAEEQAILDSLEITP